jgi:hypothetical protein
MSKSTAAGWYPDARTPGTERYWDGAAWSEQRRPDSSLKSRSGGVAALWACLIGGAIVYSVGVGLVLYSWGQAFDSFTALDENSSSALGVGVIAGCLLASLGVALAFVGLIGFGVKLGREAARV